MAVFTGTAGADTLIGSTSADELYGLGGNDSLSGSNGNDTLVGGAGADTIDGGAGVDTVSYADATSAISVALTGGTGTGSGTVGDAAGDVLTTVETIVGSAYNDTLSAVGASAGTQTLQGGLGDDVYILAGNGSGSVTVVEASGEGIDEIRTARATATLTANVENLTYTSTGAFTGIGNEMDNVITGGTGADILRGGAGADTLNGGGGVDLASYLDATSGVSVNLATGVGTGIAAGDIFNSIEGFEGSNYNDTLTGDPGGNLLRGQNGADLLVGGAGADTIDGGAGVDTVSYADATSAISVALTGGTGTGSGTVGDAAGDVLTTVETIVGSAYNDTLSAVGASSGTQTLQGGLGDDVYILAGNGSGSVTVVEASGEGIDEIRTARATATLTANVENLTYTSTGAFTGIGNEMDNVITGGTGADILRGGAGADTLNGGGGVDLASYLDATSGVSVNLATGVGTGIAAGDVFNSIEGLEGSNYGDVLVGDANNNTLKGQGGADILEGGAGADTLDGGSGVDLASYANASSAVSVNLHTATHTGDAAGDTFTGIEGIIGSAYADSLTGGNLADILIGGGGADQLDGGNGNDIAAYITSAAAVSVNLATGTASGGDAAGDTFTSIEGVYGSSFNDVLTGTANADFLEGGWGDDTIYGGAGNDVIHGHYSSALPGLVAPGSTAQNDYLDGGAGNDTISSSGFDYGTTIAGGQDNDQINVLAALADGGDGADTLTASGNGYEIRGGAGDDVLNMGGYYQAPNTLAGVADGGDGSDSFYMISSGNVAVYDSGSTGSDHLYLSNWTLSEIQIVTSGYDVWITTTSDLADGVVDNGVYLEKWNDPSNLYKTIEFFHASDGSFTF